MKKVFIDGGAGTTGLKIKERLAARDDIELISLSETERKDAGVRKEAINASDITFLCLPDQAAEEAVSFCENKNTVIIDTSTANRVKDGWVYGFSELEGQRELIKSSKRIANPGCHAIGFISLIAPLVKYGIIKDADELVCFSLTGYSGGGKKMIAEYEDNQRSALLSAPRIYGLSQNHKHIPEMMKICGLKKAPVFIPTVAMYYSGMQVTVGLFDKKIGEIKDIYKNYYKSGVVSVSDGDEEGFLSAAAMSGKDSMKIGVFGNDERLTLVSRFDNLGKGACGQAIQNMNAIIGVPEETGLFI